jgi:adenosine deaminase
VNLPKADMHVHLEGAIPRALVPELARANDSLDQLPAKLLADADLRWASPAEWLRCMSAVGDACLRDPEDYARVSDAVVASLRAQGVVYAEIGVGALRARKLPCGLPGVL